MKRMTIILLAVVLVLSTSLAAAQSPTIRYVINYTSATIPANAAQTIQAAGGQLVRSFPQVGIAIAVSSNPGFAAAMRLDASVDSAGETGFERLPETTVIGESGAPVPGVDVLYANQWDIRRVYADVAWAAGYTGGANNTVVAVIDTGIASNHPDLSGKIVYNACFASVPCIPYPSYSFHATHVAGTVAARFGGGAVVGVGPDLKLANYNVFELFPDGAVRAYFDSVWSAMLDTAAQGFDVINMSLGAVGFFYQGDGAFWTAQNRVANYVRSQGVVIVAAAGNEALNLNGPSFNVPGGVPGILDIGATGIRPQPQFPQAGAYDVKSYFSNYGAVITLVAPGGDCGLPDSCNPATRPPNFLGYTILSSSVTPNPRCAARESCPVGYAYAIGTSMASPHVAGVAALVRDAFPSLSPNQVESLLKQTAQPLGDQQLFGHGMVDAAAALGLQ